MTSISLDDRIIGALFLQSKDREKCPFIKRDTVSPFCSKGYKEGRKVRITRRMVCDVASLQLWCLTPNYERCIHYKGEDV